MKTPIPKAGPGLVRFVSVTVYRPGQQPEKFDGGRILAAGMQNGTPLCAVRDEATQDIIEFMGLPLEIRKSDGAGLVAAGSSLVPGTSI